MRARDLAQLKDQPACSHNSVTTKSGCSRPTPGATAGGCAFDGAQIALLPITDVAHIVHGPISCAGNSWDNRGSRSSGPLLYKRGLTTDVTEQDVIMGRGEKRLLHGIRQAIDDFAPAAVFVYVTCVPALEGDDVEAVCKTASELWGTPVIPVDCAGFYGSKNFGNRLAGEAMVRHVIGGREPPPKPLTAEGRPVHDIALVGEYNVAGEFWLVAPLFERLGYRVLCCLAGDARFAEVQMMHRAEALMVVCAKAMLNVAAHLEQRWQVPFFEGSFYGIRDTSEALRTFARLCADDDLMGRTEVLIAEQEALCRARLAPYIERLQGKRVLLYTGGVKSWSVVSALQELGITVVATGTRKSTEADKARIVELMGEEARMLTKGSATELLKVAHDCQADLLMAGGRNMYTALKARLPFLDINQEREHPYAGYDGMVVLAERLCQALESPIWPLVRSAAPWAGTLLQEDILCR